MVFTRPISLALVAMITLIVAAGAHAQSDRRDQVSAATARAVEGMRGQIAQEPVGRNVTVGDVLSATGGSGTLRKTLCRAQIIGGPRWIDEQTCQVQLEMPGPRVAAALLQIVDANPKKSPITSDVLWMRLRDWDNRTFSAIGTSTGAAAVENVRPIEDGNAWASVTDQARQQSIAAARQQAAAIVLDEIRPIALAGGKTIGDVLATDPATRGAVEKWVASRPVTQVEFRNDRQVRVTVATPSDELLDAFRAAAEKSDAVAKLDEAAWTRVRNDFATGVSPTSRGSARAGDGAAPANRVAAFVDPAAAPPAWIGNQLNADGVGSAGGSRLKSARLAEADAQTRLRAQIETLALAPGLSVGEASKQDARLSDTVDRAIARARVTKVDYQSDGSAKLRITLDLRNLWEEISASR